MPTVFRVENDEREGPYRSFALFGGNYGRDVDNPWLTNHDGDDHPSPWMDGLKARGSNARCGFANLSQLEAWFSDTELVRLAQEGFRVMEIEADIVDHGQKQVFFYGRKSTKVFL